MKLFFFAIVSAAAFMGMVLGQIIGDIPYSTLCGNNPQGPGGIHWVCFEQNTREQIAFDVDGGKMVLDPNDVKGVAVYLKHPSDWFTLKSGFKNINVKWFAEEGCVLLSGDINRKACKGEVVQI
ncbi:uncharacterized protein UTRI_02669 [Ustilago trichophora]|uniref:Mig1 protein n=1 Tax=Ustilago trichophora TaxID=86804 RepID=A0A5C3ENN9_9BASI|nr:uncharacterized protein UTRI_02669 [Ustilago trichophora]